jgi:hypothetical protein
MEELAPVKILEKRRNIFSSAFLADKIRTNEAAFLFLVALVSRLIAWPFSQAMEADATSRLFLAEHALAHHGELASLQWPSLHIYFLSATQFISHDRVAGPVLMSILLGAFAVIPFYKFTKNVFGETGAFYAALIFTFSPMIFRLSLTPLSEIYHICFSATAMWCLSEGIVKQKNKIRWAVFGGIAATIAAGGRLEAWILIALLGIILLFMREWKMFFVFGFFASVFPVWWMIFCYRTAGSAFVSAEMVQWQNFIVGNVNAHLDSMEKFKRTIFFPFSWMYCITPFAALICLWAFFKAIFKKTITRVQLLFGGLFLFFLPFFIYQSQTGALTDQHRYTVSLELFSLPFFAMWLEDSRKLKLKKTIAIFIAVLLIPWSYTWQRFPWNKLFTGSAEKKEAVSEIVVNAWWQSEAIPSLDNPVYDRITGKVNASLKPGDGLFIDFAGWCETFYIAQQSHLAINDMYIVPPAENHKGDHGYIKLFFENHPIGMILLSDLNQFSTEQNLTGSLLEFDSVPGGALLSPLFVEQHLRLFRYIYLGDEACRIKKHELNGTLPLYIPKKDVDYYIRSIHENVNWHAQLWKKAMRNFTSVESEVRKNAEYLVAADEENKKKEKLKQDSAGKPVK